MMNWDAARALITITMIRVLRIRFDPRANSATRGTRTRTSIIWTLAKTQRKMRMISTMMTRAIIAVQAIAAAVAI